MSIGELLFKLSRFLSSNTWVQTVCSIYPLAAYMLVFKARVAIWIPLKVWGNSLVRMQHALWNRVTTGRIDHKINAKSKLVEFDAILSIVSVAADAE